jgi:hypothetical protein
VPTGERLGLAVDFRHVRLPLIVSTSMRRDKTLIGLVTVVILHLAVTVAHGSAHAAAGVNLSPVGLAFVFTIIVLGPLAGLVWMWTNPRSGALLIGMTMAAALLFGLINHFVIPGADRIDEVHGPAQALFETTAVLLVLTESAGAALGAYGWHSIRRML